MLDTRLLGLFFIGDTVVRAPVIISSILRFRSGFVVVKAFEVPLTTATTPFCCRCCCCCCCCCNLCCRTLAEYASLRLHASIQAARSTAFLIQCRRHSRTATPRRSNAIAFSCILFNTSSGRSSVPVLRSRFSGALPFPLSFLIPNGSCGEKLWSSGGANIEGRGVWMASGLRNPRSEAEVAGGVSMLPRR